MSGGAFCGLTGRAAADAERRESKGGTTYATCRLAVDIDRQREGDPDPQPWWITAMAFGRSADALAAVRKGEALRVAGRRCPSDRQIGAVTGLGPRGGGVPHRPRRAEREHRGSGMPSGRTPPGAGRLPTAGAGCGRKAA